MIRFCTGALVGSLAVAVLGVIAELPAYRCEQFGRMLDLPVFLYGRECFAIRGAEVIRRDDLEERLISSRADHLGHFAATWDDPEPLDVQR